VSRARVANLAAAFTSTLLAAGLGCTGGSGNPNPGLPATGNGGSGSVHPPSGEVVVSIATPVRSDPPPSYGSGSLIEVLASVTIANGTDFIDGTSIRATVTRQGSTQVLESGQLVLDAGASYSGRVSLGDLQSDTYTLTVTARSSGGAVGVDSLDFVIDAGPIVTVTSPVEGRSYKRTLTIEVVATDPFGLMGPPTATVGSIPVTLEPSGVDNTFRGTIDFDAQDPPLFGDQLLTVAAVNNNGKRTEVQVVFFIDNDGPRITDTHPVPGEIIGAVITISATVNDGAGVLDSSVIAIIGDETGTPLFELPLKPRGGGVYSVLFDSARLTKCKEPPSVELCIVFPTISFRASDQIGNETVVGYDFAVDNIAPIADLDPPHLRDSALDRVLRCSHEFDPLGNNNFAGDMPNDLKMAPQVFDLRARIQDDGNRAVGLKLTPLSLVDPLETSVYVMTNTGMPLIVDTDGNGSCDSINPLLIPTTEPPVQNDQVLKVRLAPVPIGGAADFTPDGTLPLPYCESGIAPEKPEPMCTFLQPTIAIRYFFDQPAIWSVEPIDDLHCHGNQFDAKANHIADDAWACIAVGTKDHVGNFSVSPPLRVYIDYEYGGLPDTVFGPAPPAAAGPAPSCTGIYDKATNTVRPGACTTREFTRNVATGEGYRCYRGDCS
jgi:hypothetical protein